MLTLTSVLGIQGSRQSKLTDAWQALRNSLSDQRSLLGTERLGHYCSGKGIDPQQVDDGVIAAFMTELREMSLHKKPRQRHRKTTIVWNEIAARLSDVGLATFSVPASRRVYTRARWEDLPESFREDTEKYLAWYASKDPFAKNRRKRKLALGTIEIVRGHINAAATALVKSGVSAASIKGLADLITAEAVHDILNYRHSAVGAATTNLMSP